jgi:DNA mismatch repair protein MutL
MLVSVNGRFVRSRSLNEAIKAGYGTLLPKDRFPVAFLNLTLDTACVDVNVHPTKKEIRLSGESEITKALRDLIGTTLLTQDLIPSVGSSVSSAEITVVSPVSDQQSYDHLPPANPAAVFECSHAGTVSTDQRLRQTELLIDAGLPVPESGLLPEIDVIGEFGGIYILGRTPDDELLIIDQHAAHERILYEQVCRHSADSVEKQELISPVLLHRTPREASLLRELLPLLTAEGFVLDEFGSGSFLVRSVPVILGRLEDASLMDEIISDLLSDERSLRVSPRERILRVIACRGAVKAGTVCSVEQCRRIVSQLRRTQNPFTCPHGRPTIVRFSRRDLDALFKRI